jgi:hypothetical protein
MMLSRRVRTNNQSARAGAEVVKNSDICQGLTLSDERSMMARACFRGRDAFRRFQLPKNQNIRQRRGSRVMRVVINYRISGESGCLRAA